MNVEFILIERIYCRWEYIVLNLFHSEYDKTLVQYLDTDVAELGTHIWVKEQGLVAVISKELYQTHLCYI